MEQFVQYTLYIHAFAGMVALLTGAIAIVTPKGKTWHLKSGKVYFLAMTVVFITGIVVAGFRFNRFLFLIAFLSYYSVFAGLRILRLKQLHREQQPKWFDWGAGMVNALANLFFIAMGVYLFIASEARLGGVLLSIGFGIGGLMISYVNLKPFIVRPTKPYHWYTAHIGNMMGGYIATFTAFLSTIVSRFELMNPFLAFAIPSLIGIPLLIYWTQKIERQFADG